MALKNVGSAITIAGWLILGFGLKIWQTSDHYGLFVASLQLQCT